MTGLHSDRRRGAARGPLALRLGLDPASVPGRARADAWPLLLTVLVVALGVGIAAVTPRLADRTEREAVEAAVSTAGARGTLVVSYGLDEWLGGVSSQDGVVEQVTRVADGVDASVARELPGLDPHGVRAVVSRTLPLTDVTDPRGETTVQFAHAWQADGPAVTWVQGDAPGDSPDPDRPAGDDAPARVVEVAVSEATAAFLGVGPGDDLPSPAVTNGPSRLLVTGVFRADDPADPAWATVPELLTPAPHGDEVVLQTGVALWCTAESFADAFAALPEGTFTVSYTYRADPEQVADAGADAVVRALNGVIANPGLVSGGMWSEVRTELPDVLAEVVDQIRAARAQAAVLVGVVGAGSVLTIALAAWLLTSRRRVALEQHRARGAALAAVAVELTVESVSIAALGTALGLAAAAVVVPGPTPWLTAGPVVLVALLATPVLGVRAASAAAGGRRPGGDRRHRRSARERVRDAAVRRAVLEVVVLAAAAGAVATAHARAVADGGLGVVLAPILAAVVGALAVFRVVPWVLAVAMAAARRSRHAVPVLAVGRAGAATHGPVLVTVTAIVGLACFAAVLTATLATGRDQASWDAIGADATAVTRPGEDVVAAADHLGGVPDVDLALAVRVEDVRFKSSWGAVGAHLVAASAADLTALASLTPVGGPDAERQIAALGADGAPGGDGLAALVSDDLLAHSTQDLGVWWFGSWVPVHAVGRAPAVDGHPDGLVVVDAAAFDAAVASSITPNAVWVVGDDAAAAVAAVSAEPALRDADVTARQTWLDARRSDPSVSAVTALTLVAAGLLAVLAVLAVVLGAAAGAPDRARTLATLRAVGIGSSQSWRIALGELAPQVLLASVGGVGVGALVARLVAGALDLALVTGQARDPVLVVPWWVATPVVLLMVVVTVVVAVEASARRRERLGQVLRIGAQR